MYISACSLAYITALHKLIRPEWGTPHSPKVSDRSLTIGFRLVTYPGHSLRGWVLLLCGDAAGVFHSFTRVGWEVSCERFKGQVYTIGGHLCLISWASAVSQEPGEEISIPPKRHGNKQKDDYLLDLSVTWINNGPTFSETAPGWAWQIEHGSENNIKNVLSSC